MAGLYWVKDEQRVLYIYGVRFDPVKNVYACTYAGLWLSMMGGTHMYVNLGGFHDISPEEARRFKPLPVPSCLIGQGPLSTAARVVLEDLAGLPEVNEAAVADHLSRMACRIKPLRFLQTWWRKTVGDWYEAETLPEWLASRLADLPMEHLQGRFWDSSWEGACLIRCRRTLLRALARKSRCRRAPYVCFETGFPCPTDLHVPDAQAANTRSSSSQATSPWPKKTRSELQSPRPAQAQAKTPMPKASPSLTEILMALPTPAPEFSLEMQMRTPGSARQGLGQGQAMIERIRDIFQRAEQASHDLNEALTDLSAVLDTPRGLSFCF